MLILYLKKENNEDLNTLDKYIKEKNVLDKFTIKGSQLIKPKFAYPGACAGCGETAYLK